MRIGDKQYGTLDLGTNDITSAGDVSKALSTGFAFWKLIQEVSLDADTATIEFNGIPQDFRHLVIVCSLRSTQASADEIALVTFNGDTGANYDCCTLQVNDSATLSGVGSDGPGTSDLRMSLINSGNGPADAFSPVSMTILDYANTSRHKAVHSASGGLLGTAAGNIRVHMGSGRWRNTNAVTSVKLAPSAGNFASGSMASLYGTDV